MVSAWEAGSRRDGREPKDKSVNELVTDLTEQLRRLARAEVKLALVEGKRKAKRAGVGAGSFGAAGLFAVIGLCVLVAAAVLALALVWPAWLAALVVGGAALLLAGLAAMFGRSALRRSLPPVPLWAMSSLRQDIDTIKKGARR